MTTPASDQLNWYISGFVDGEGCFCVSFQRNLRVRMGWEVRPSFSVSQNQDRAQLLVWLHDHWNCGSLRPDRSDQTVKFEVRALDGLLNIVIPHFQKYPLQSAKQLEVERFAAICRLMSQRRNRDKEGLEAIASLAVSMNPSGKRRYPLDQIIA